LILFHLFFYLFFYHLLNENESDNEKEKRDMLVLWPAYASREKDIKGNRNTSIIDLFIFYIFKPSGIRESRPLGQAYYFIF
jgi:hypothetical protein